MWLDFRNTDTNLQIACAIWSSKRECYDIGIRGKGQLDLFGGDNIERFESSKDAKPWDIMADLKARVEKIYGKVNYTDYTLRWPHSKKESDKWEADMKRDEENNREYWKNERARRKLSMAMAEYVREADEESHPTK